MMIMVSRRDAEGSSPLARGLLRTLIGDLEEIRIIPARAGFTLYPAGRGAGT